MYVSGEKRDKRSLSSWSYFHRKFEFCSRYDSGGTHGFPEVPSLLFVPPISVRIAELALLGRRIDITPVLRVVTSAHQSSHKSLGSTHHSGINGRVIRRVVFGIEGSNSWASGEGDSESSLSSSRSYGESSARGEGPHSNGQSLGQHLEYPKVNPPCPDSYSLKNRGCVRLAAEKWGIGNSLRFGGRRWGLVGRTWLPRQ